MTINAPFYEMRGGLCELFDLLHEMIFDFLRSSPCRRCCTNKKVWEEIADYPTFRLSHASETNNRNNHPHLIGYNLPYRDHIPNKVGCYRYSLRFCTNLRDLNVEEV